MKTIHLILQGKGGVGKSFISSTLAQYILHKDSLPLCIDTDPINKTFSAYQVLEVKKLELLENEQINPRNFDLLIEWVSSFEGKNIVVDNGASTFVPLSHYFVINDIPELLHSLHHRLMVHTVITGGQAMMDTIHGFSQLAHQFPEPSTFVVWLNPYWGEIEYEGLSFENMKVFQKHKHRIEGVISIPSLQKETFGRDLSDMLQERITFDEAIASSTRTIMVRQRLKMLQRQLFEQIEEIRIFEKSV